MFVTKLAQKEINSIGWKLIILDWKKALKISNCDCGDIFKFNGEYWLILDDLPLLSKEEEGLIENIRLSLSEMKCVPTKEIVFSYLEDYCNNNLIEMEDDQKLYLFSVLCDAIFDFGPFSKILKSDYFEEISINGIGKNSPVRVFHKSFGWIKVNFFIDSENYFKELVNKFARSVGRRLSTQSPCINACLKNGDRLHAAIPPISFSGPSLTIRKFRNSPFTPLNLLSNDTFSLDMLVFLWFCFQIDCNILFVGNTGSGKTSSLNALFSFVPKNERIIIVEETPEISIPHNHCVKLSVTDNLNYKMNDLILDTFRMRPDKIIVGEIRSKNEVSAYIDTILAGQAKGAFATFHGSSSKETIQRLNNLGIDKMDISSIDLIVVQRRWNDFSKGINSGNTERRKVFEICEVVLKDSEIFLNTIYCFDLKSRKFIKKNNSLKVKEKILESFGFTETQYSKEYIKRKKALLKIKFNDFSLSDFFNFVNEIS